MSPSDGNFSGSLILIPDIFLFCISVLTSCNYVVVLLAVAYSWLFGCRVGGRVRDHTRSHHVTRRTWTFREGCREDEEGRKILLQRTTEWREWRCAFTGTLSLRICKKVSSHVPQLTASHLMALSTMHMGITSIRLSTTIIWTLTGSSSRRESSPWSWSDDARWLWRCASFFFPPSPCACYIPVTFWAVIVWQDFVHLELKNVDHFA